MRISPLSQNNFYIPFKSRTAYYDNKVVEEDVLTLENSKSYYSNPVSPNQDFIGFNLIKENQNTIQIKSRYKHLIGTIKQNPDAELPKINLIAGSHQPVIEIVDEDLGIKILLNRGSNLKSENLNIDYEKISEKKIFVDKNKNVSFGNNIYIATGYKSEKTEEEIRNYFNKTKNFQVQKSYYADKIKNDYSIVGLAAGYGTRLKPISDLTDASKPLTKFPSVDKNFLEISCLDTAARAGNIKYYYFLRDEENNLSGTAGPIVKGLKSGKIPTDKPLVLLTSDTFTNIDLAKVLYDFEQDPSIGIGVVLKDVSNENLNNVPLVQTGYFNDIEKFHEKINRDNYSKIINKNSDLYSSTNIMVIHPKILEYLKKFADENGNADFLAFLDVMFNTMNKNWEALDKKYPNGLGNKELKLDDLMSYIGYPKQIKDDNSRLLKVKAIYAKDIKGDNPRFADIGTIEKFIETVKDIKNSDNINGINSDFIRQIKNNIDDNGVIYMQPEARVKLRQFKDKYDIKQLSGNVIVSEIPTKKRVSTPTKNESELYELTEKKSPEFIKKILENPNDLKLVSKSMIATYGFDKFLKWYLSDEGYYGAYEKYVDDLYKNADSIDELLKFMPNWSPWKLEEKFWRLKNPYLKHYSDKFVQSRYNEELDHMREQPFTIGKLPVSYFTPSSFEELVQKIRTDNVKEGSVYADNYFYTVKRLKGGELNDKYVFKISKYGQNFILKMDRSYAEDNENVWLYDKKVIKKNKVLMADSNFTNACISRYLELNGCKNIPKLLYYDYKNDAALYEFVEDAKGDLFQQGVIDTEYSDLNLSNNVIENLREKGIYLNDTALKNFFTEKDGTQKIIDLGHANFIMPFKPGIKHYNVEFSNINGPDFRTIYASFL